MSGIVLHTIRLTLAVRVYQLNHLQTIVADAIRFRNSQWISQHGLDGPPHIDDLHSVLEKLFGFLGEVVWDARLCGRVGLIDVHALNWAANTFVGAQFNVGRCPANCMVEDEDAGCAGAMYIPSAFIIILHTMLTLLTGSRYKYIGHDLRVLQELLHLGIVLLLDLLLVQEIFLLAHVLVELESGLIQRIFFFATSHIVYSNVVGFCLTFEGLWPIYISRMRRRAIGVGLEVMQHSIYILRFVCRGRSWCDLVENLMGERGGGLWELYCGGSHVESLMPSGTNGLVSNLAVMYQSVLSINGELGLSILARLPHIVIGSSVLTSNTLGYVSFRSALTCPASTQYA